MPKSKKPTSKSLARTRPGRRAPKITKADSRPKRLADRSLARRTETLEAGLHGIGRVTDALVTRVAGSTTREPSGHHIKCDTCQLRSPGERTPELAARLAERLGWQVGDLNDYCPEHRTDRPLLGDGKTPAPLPAELTSAELILVTRLNWVGQKIAEGFLPKSLIQESFRTDHRSMLSDLARPFGYSTVPLIEQATLLLTRGADLHPVFSERTSDAWEFFLALFDLLRGLDEP